MVAHEKKNIVNIQIPAKIKIPRSFIWNQLFSKRKEKKIIPYVSGKSYLYKEVIYLKIYQSGIYAYIYIHIYIHICINDIPYDKIFPGVLKVIFCRLFVCRFLESWSAFLYCKDKGCESLQSWVSTVGRIVL